MVLEIERRGSKQKASESERKRKKETDVRKKDREKRKERRRKYQREKDWVKGENKKKIERGIGCCNLPLYREHTNA